VALAAGVKTTLQAKKNRAEQDRVTAVSLGAGNLAAWAAREKADADRVAQRHADTLT
jgi:predicted patatin/cPLA2 family phospholipase